MRRLKRGDLVREIQRMWVVRTNVVPVVVGALGTVPLRLRGNLKELGVQIDTFIALVQKSAF